MPRFPIFAVALLPLSTPAAADPAEVVDAEFRNSANGLTASVTIRHGDTGWDDYADGWRVETAEGQVLGTRVLLHPHVEEQPFTRSLPGVEIPPDTLEVFVRTRTSVTGWAGTVSGPFAVP